MIKFKKYFILFSLLIYCQRGNAYIHNQTNDGTYLRWSQHITTIDLYVNSTNTQSAGVQAITDATITNSINAWNGLSRITIRKNTTTLTEQDFFNEIYFSNDPILFNGNGIVGLTLVSFNESTGEIVAGDILINDNFSFSSNLLSDDYLGNVITHELGHFLGLGHEQVLGSSMNYTLSSGQSTLSDDEKAGVYSLYPNNNANKGSISGNIIGGKNLVPVFGAHVEAISVKTGTVMGATITEIDGKFTIDGLPIDDQYFIYTRPIKDLGLPDGYANVRNDFCDGSNSYRGSFFQSCGASFEGFPQSVKLSSSTGVDVGNITIRCGLDTAPEYIQNKSITPSPFDLNAYNSSSTGGAFIGFFTTNETEDYFRVNLSSITNWDTVNTSPNLYLELKVINQIFYSIMKAELSVTRVSTNLDITPALALYTQEADGQLKIDSTIRLAINRADPTANNFEFKIVPKFSFPMAGIAYLTSELFPSYSTMRDDLNFYFAIATIVKDNGDGTFTQVAFKNDLLSDNSLCPDGKNTYALTNYSARGITSNTLRPRIAACGTIVDKNNGAGGNGQNGPGSFLIGLFFCFIVALVITRYSKMA